MSKVTSDDNANAGGLSKIANELSAVAKKSYKQSDLTKAREAHDVAARAHGLIGNSKEREYHGAESQRMTGHLRSPVESIFADIESGRSVSEAVDKELSKGI